MRITQGRSPSCPTSPTRRSPPRSPTRWPTAGRCRSSSPTTRTRATRYWEMWGLPMFDLRDAGRGAAWRSTPAGRRTRALRQGQRLRRARSAGRPPRCRSSCSGRTKEPGFRLDRTGGRRPADRATRRTPTPPSGRPVTATGRQHGCTARGRPFGCAGDDPVPSRSREEPRAAACRRRRRPRPRCAHEAGVDERARRAGPRARRAGAGEDAHRGDRRAAAGRPDAGALRRDTRRARPCTCASPATPEPARPRSRCGWPSCCTGSATSRKGTWSRVTRDDLVGEYVGHTAPKTKEVVKRAMGGVLFIDEAYYLYKAENERDYGGEAIEILLQVMENHRDDLVVILAGYADRMDGFFAANPGMQSRVAHHVTFPDFTRRRAGEIGVLMTRRRRLPLLRRRAGRCDEYLRPAGRAAVVRQGPQRAQRAGAGPAAPGAAARRGRRARRRAGRRPHARRGGPAGEPRVRGGLTSGRRRRTELVRRDVTGRGRWADALAWSARPAARGHRTRGRVLAPSPGEQHPSRPAPTRGASRALPARRDHHRPDARVRGARRAGFGAWGGGAARGHRVDGVRGRRALAEEVGVALVERDGRGVRLTAAGRRYAGYARRVLGLLDEAAARGPGRGRPGARTRAARRRDDGRRAPAAGPAARRSGARTRASGWSWTSRPRRPGLADARPPRGGRRRGRAAAGRISGAGSGPCGDNTLVVVGAPDADFAPATATWLLRESGSGIRDDHAALLDDLQVDPPTAGARLARRGGSPRRGPGWASRSSRARPCADSWPRRALVGAAGARVRPWPARGTWSPSAPRDGEHRARSSPHLLATRDLAGARLLRMV